MAYLTPDDFIPSEGGGGETNAQGESPEEAEKKAFLTAHGAMFNNNEDIGLSVLNELKRRGVETKAATDEAIESILDSYRKEIAQLSDALGSAKQQVEQLQNQQADLLSKADTMDKAVQSATGQPENQEAGIDGGAQPMSEALAPGAAAAPETSAPVTEAPSTAPATEMPAPETPAPETPAPGEGSEAPAQPLPPDANKNPAETTVSDERMKVIQKPKNNSEVFAKIHQRASSHKKPAGTTVSDERMKNIKSSAFSEAMISAARRSW